MNREFTGKNMAAILVIGFGIVAAVNFLMASYAVSGFGGVIVENSYVASQKFNGWLEEAERSKALGWTAQITREDGYLLVKTNSVPADATVSANLRRPLGEQETLTLAFADMGEGQFRSTAPVDAGRWTVRLAITAGGEEWLEEVPLR